MHNATAFTLVSVNSNNNQRNIKVVNIFGSFNRRPFSFFFKK